jgi:hypothetical protein
VSEHTLVVKRRRKTPLLSPGIFHFGLTSPITRSDDLLRIALRAYRQMHIARFLHLSVGEYPVNY